MEETMANANRTGTFFMFPPRIGLPDGQCICAPATLSMLPPSIPGALDEYGAGEACYCAAAHCGTRCPMAAPRRHPEPGDPANRRRPLFWYAGALLRALAL